MSWDGSAVTTVRVCRVEDYCKTYCGQNRRNGTQIDEHAKGVGRGAGDARLISVMPTHAGRNIRRAGGHKNKARYTVLYSAKRRVETDYRD